MLVKLKYFCGLVSLATATVSLPAQAFSYSCEDLYAAQVAFDDADAAYQAANLPGRRGDAWSLWYHCSNSAPSVDAKYWCDQEYENTTQLIWEEEQALLLEISIRQSERDSMYNHLVGQGIVCT